MTSGTPEPTLGTADRWQPPPRDECWEETVPVPLDNFHLITMRRLEWNGQLVEYAIIHSRKNDDGEYVEVMCIDTMHHGSVHRHDGPDHKKSIKVIRTIDTQQDVQESFETSFDEVYGSYMESVKGFDLE